MSNSTKVYIVFLKSLCYCLKKIVLNWNVKSVSSCLFPLRALACVTLDLVQKYQLKFPIFSVWLALLHIGYRHLFSYTSLIRSTFCVFFSCCFVLVLAQCSVTSHTLINVKVNWQHCGLILGMFKINFLLFSLLWEQRAKFVGSLTEYPIYNRNIWHWMLIVFYYQRKQFFIRISYISL